MAFIVVPSLAAFPAAVDAAGQKYPKRVRPWVPRGLESMEGLEALDKLPW
jgi:hypothetical protein